MPSMSLYHTIDRGLRSLAQLAGADMGAAPCWAAAFVAEGVTTEEAEAVFAELRLRLVEDVGGPATLAHGLRILRIRIRASGLPVAPDARPPERQATGSLPGQAIAE